MTAREFLAAVQQRAAAATSGPWMKDPDEPSIVLKPDAPGGWDGTAIATVQRDDYGLVEEANTEFIAASRTDVPRLVAALTAALDLAREWESVAINAGAFYPEASAYADGQEAALHSAAESLIDAIEGRLFPPKEIDR